MPRREPPAELLADWRSAAQLALAHLDSIGSLCGHPGDDAACLSEVLGDPIDLVVRAWSGGQVTLLYLNSLCQGGEVLKMVGSAVQQGDWTGLPTLPLDGGVAQVVGTLLKGDAVLLRQNMLPYGWRIEAAKAVLSKALQASTERVVRGPRAALSGDLTTSLGLLRSLLPSPNLRLKECPVGRAANKPLVVAYLDDAADSGVGQELARRLQRITVDGITDVTQLGHAITAAPWSPFPTLQPTERTDAIAMALLDGRYAILLHGSDSAILLPTRFADLMQTPEDAYLPPYMASFNRAMRWLASIATITFSSIYIALVTVHPELIPTPLIVSISQAHTGVPFPAFAEVLIMEIAVEMIREASIRLASPLSQTITIVGVLVTGQAVVTARIISAPVIIVVMSTALVSTVLPLYETSLALRLLRFPAIVLAAFTGLYGIVWYLLLLLGHLSQLRSFGVPYLAPLAPARRSALGGAMLVAPMSARQTGQQSPTRGGRGRGS